MGRDRDTEELSHKYFLMKIKLNREHRTLVFWETNNFYENMRDKITALMQSKEKRLKRAAL